MDSFWDLTILISLAAGLSLIANRLKQPLILGYIAAGIIIQVTGVLDSHAVEGFEVFSKMGIVFLLFILGLELDWKEMNTLGTRALAIAIGQIIFTVIFGFSIAILLDYEIAQSFIIAIALTFSSTIVIVKLLSRTNELETMHGKIATRVLLIQDLVAIVILILLAASLSDSDISPKSQLLKMLITGPLVVISLILINKYVIPRLIEFTQHDREVLFISVISLALLFAGVLSTEFIGLSTEVGALAAGIALSNRREALQIESWTKPLRDFFIPIFFVLLGFQIQVGSIAEVLVPSLIFSIYVLIGNPIVVMTLMKFLKFDSITGFKTGLTVAQISEFSLLVANMALANGTLKDADLTMLTLVGGITMTGSSYLILYSDQLYEKLKPLLKVVKLHKEEVYNADGYSRKQLKNRIVIFGFNRMAGSLADVIKSKDKKFIVIDNDPSRLDYADKLGATTAFGDLKDETLINDLKLQDSDLIISTVPDMTANLVLLQYVKDNNIDVPVIVNAFHDVDAIELYKEGASFVIHPYLLVSGFLHRVVTNKDTEASLGRAAEKDLAFLKSRK
jgi:Kef-type K+ transport system membrane component KefB